MATTKELFYSAKEIPEFWKQQYKNLLELDVIDDKNGSLQDVHWSHGSFEYFPSYSLGSLYAAKFFSAADKDLKNLEEQVGEGNFLNLLDWLRKNIHSKGRTYTSEELCQKITGNTLQIEHFTNYLLHKYKLIY